MADGAAGGVCVGSTAGLPRASRASGRQSCTGLLFPVATPFQAALGSHPAGGSVSDPFPSCWLGVGGASLPALTRGGDSLGT